MILCDCVYCVLYISRYLLHVVVESEAAEEGSKGKDGGGDPGGGGGSGQEVDCHPGTARHHELGIISG